MQTEKNNSRGWALYQWFLDAEFWRRAACWILDDQIIRFYMRSAPELKYESHHEQHAESWWAAHQIMEEHCVITLNEQDVTRMARA